MGDTHEGLRGGGGNKKQWENAFAKWEFRLLFHSKSHSNSQFHGGWNGESRFDTEWQIAKAELRVLNIEGGLASMPTRFP